MKEIKIRHLVMSAGRPKICVPLIGATTGELHRELEYIPASCCDLFEWRADGFSEGVKIAAPRIYEAAGKKPVLFTLRSDAEGGSREIQKVEYLDIVGYIVERKLCDAVDIEFSRVRYCSEIIDAARERGIAVVISRHDFSGTPGKAYMIKALEEMKAAGADLPKLAVMPKENNDVLNLLSATEEASGKIGPVITMSMGAKGLMSRVFGYAFGSCLTFAAGLNGSAPGQIDSDRLKRIFDELEITD